MNNFSPISNSTPMWPLSRTKNPTHCLNYQSNLMTITLDTPSKARSALSTSISNCNPSAHSSWCLSTSNSRKFRNPTSRGYLASQKKIKFRFSAMNATTTSRSRLGSHTKSNAAQPSLSRRYWWSSASFWPFTRLTTSNTLKIVMYLKLNSSLSPLRRA